MRFKRIGLALTAVVALGVALLAAAPAQASTGTAAIGIIKASDSHVSIPSNYVYDPTTKHQKTLHDYCSHSPDSWLWANFRGPCARHDMCYEYHQKSQTGCDNQLGSQLAQECRSTYGSLNPLRYQCEEVAAGYWAAVTVHTIWPW